MLLLPFKKQDGILNKSPFVQDEVRFNLIHRIADDPGALLLRSEDNRVLVARSSPQLPMWVWLESCQNSLVQETVLALRELTKEEDSFALISYQEVVEAGKDVFPRWEMLMEMEAFECPEVKSPQETKGEMVRAILGDLETVIDYCVGFIYWGFGKEVARESQREGATRLVTSGNLYLLKVEDQPVSMTFIAHRGPRHARINYVFTPPEHRKRGYASKLVGLVTGKILEDGLTPVLYTDLTNSTSNKVYQDLGYQKQGKVHHYKFYSK